MFLPMATALTKHPTFLSFSKKNHSSRLHVSFSTIILSSHNSTLQILTLITLPPSRPLIHPDSSVPQAFPQTVSLLVFPPSPLLWIRITCTNLSRSQWIPVRTS
ncbi:unnamed protein product [Protopolystoma xenopodis]|uniref:Uncharacterized protein n=1 Tax=Protopolystoma xenopodis TaxID=117903 RepID=A0A3S5BDJ1_9PLAT|nr:unnamed protein product [Protopolystoma xenopodis]